MRDNDEIDLLGNPQLSVRPVKFAIWNKGLKQILIIIIWGATVLTATVLLGSDELLVLKTPEILYARSSFSDDYDVVVSLTKGVNDQFDFHAAALIEKSAPMGLATCQAADVFHACSDDAAPWQLNGTYIGANHGWYGVFEMTVPDHGLTTSDIGMPWKDKRGVEFYLIKILDANRIWMMPDNAGDLDDWSFASELTGSLGNEAGQSLQTDSTLKTQLTPACRIREQAYLVDGKTPLLEGIVTSCRFLEVVDDYDIVNPAAVIATVKQRPGRIPNFVDADLDVLLTTEIRYRLQPWGACTVHHSATVKRAFTLNLTGFIQSQALLRRDGDTRRYYIPDTLAFTVDGQDHYDFGLVQDFPGPPALPLLFGTGFGNVESPERLPSRFIQLLNKRSGLANNVEIGYVVGYSLLEGCTVPAVRAANCARAAFIHTSAKTYPIAMDEKTVKIEAGTKIENLAYRQYFSPGALSQHVTAAYLHRERDKYVLYVDYHEAVKEDVIKLPPFLSGQTVTVIASTPSVELLSGETVPESGIRLAVKSGTGHIAIAISPGVRESSGAINPEG